MHATNRDHWSRLLAFTVILLCGRGLAQESETLIAGPLANLGKELHGEAAEVNWEREYAQIARNLDRIWQENKWNDEADRFAFQLARQVSAIPPWHVFDRLNLMSQSVCDRYQLDGAQASKFRASLMREAGGILVRHSGTLLKHAREIIQMNREGHPLDADQVARLVQEGMPILAETYESIDRLAQELEPSLSANQKAILERDMKSYLKRRVFVDSTVARWVDGGWHPKDWGLENDPRFREQLKERPAVQTPPAIPPPLTQSANPKVEPAQPATLVLPTRWVPHDPTTWLAYVLEAKRKFTLDAGQFTSARSIHDELAARAVDYSKSHQEALIAVPVTERFNHPLYAPICSLFNEMRERVDALPTTAQRRQAGE